MKIKMFAAAALAALAAGAENLTISSDTTIDEDRSVEQIIFTAGAKLSGTGKITVTGGIAVQAGAAEIESPVEFSGSALQTIELGANASITQDGVWSGTAPLKLAGVNKSSNVATFRGANTFDGALELTNVTINVYSDTGLGSAVGNTKWLEGKAYLYFYDGTFPEKLNSTFNSLHQQCLRIAEGCNATFTGTITLNNIGYLRVEKNATATFAGTLNGGNYFCPSVASGATIIYAEGHMPNCTVYNPGGDDATAVSKFMGYRVKNDNYQNFVIGSGTVQAQMVDNFSSKNDTAGFQINAAGTFDLNGFDHLSMGYWRAGGAGGIITSATPATIKVSGGDGVKVLSTTTGNKVTGAVSLIKRGAAELWLDNENTSTGSLTVAEGVLGFTMTGAWTGKEVNVEAGATLAVQNSFAFADDVVLSIADGGVLNLGANLTVMYVSVNDNQLPVGTYSKAKGDAFIDGSGILNVVAAPATERTITWVGGSANEAFEAAANWQDGVEPNFVAGLDSVVLAKTGTRAVMNDSATVQGVTFQKGENENGEFTLEKGEDGVELTVGAGGISAAATEGKWVIEPHTSISANSATVMVGDSSAVCPAELVFADGLSGGLLTFAGAGKVFIGNKDSTSSIGGKVALKDNYMYLGGAVDLPQGLTLSGSKIGRLYLTNAVVNINSGAAMLIDATDRYNAFNVAANTTNVINGQLALNGVSRPAFDANSQITVNSDKTCDWGSYCVPAVGDGAEIILNARITAMDLSFATGTLVMRKAGNNIQHSQWGCGFTIHYGATVRTEVEGAINSTQTMPFIKNTGVLDLCGCNQYFGPIHMNSLYCGEVRSDEPAVMTVTQTTVAPQSFTAEMVGTNYLHFVGKAGLCKKGALPLVIASVSSTTGTLEVAEGTLSFTDDGAWENVSAVNVSGGTLVLDKAKRIAKTCEMTITGGSVNLDGSFTQNVNELYIGEARAEVGTYGSSASRAQHKDDDHFTGPGILHVTHGFPDGTCILLR